MVWGAFHQEGKVPLYFCENKTFKSREYCSVLEKVVYPYAKAKFGNNFEFLADNAPIHKSGETRATLERLGIEPIPFPSKSPNLNPIENLWGILSREVYRHGNRQFATLNALKKAINREWEKLDDATLRKLV